jgi:peptidoglycan/LPS O-acetylase OafA/YrhL
MSRSGGDSNPVARRLDRSRQVAVIHSDAPAIRDQSLESVCEGAAANDSRIDLCVSGMRPPLEYIPALDGLRAIAVLAVVVYHLTPGWLPGGFVGVDVFFVLSGYLITRIIDGDGRAGTLSLGRFYQRRIARIFPALFTMAIGTLAVAMVLYMEMDRSTTGAGVAATAASVMNLKLLLQGDYFQLSADAQPLMHCWSLSLEEQFYVVYPCLLLGLRRYAVRWTLPVVAMLTLASAGACVAFTLHNPTAAFYLPVTRAWELFSGGLVAMCFDRRLRLSVRVEEACAGLGLTIVLVALFVTPAGKTFPGVWAVLPVAGVVMILVGQQEATSEGRRAMATRLLSAPVMIAIGQASYSLYLWHWPVFSFVDYAGYLWPEALRLAVKVGASCGLAVASHRLIETPSRKMLGKPDNRLMAYGVYFVGSAVLFAAGVAVRLHENVSTELGDVRRGGVRYNSHPGNPTMMLIGDSHAGMYGTLVRDICQQNGWQLVVATASGMDPLPSDQQAGNELWSLVESIIARERPSCVVLAANWSNWLSSQHGRARLDKAVDGILSHADRVVILNQAPFLPAEASRASIRKGARPPFFEQPDASELRRRVNDEVRAVPRENVVVVDVGRYFESSTGAIRFWDDQLRQLFHDRTHVSDVGAELISDELQSAIRGQNAQLRAVD